MSEKEVTIYETDEEALRNGHIYNRIKGTAYIDEETGNIDITDGPGDYSRIKGHAHIDPSLLKKKEDTATIDPIDAGNAVAGGITVFGVIIFLFSIPFSWWELTKSYEEFPIECGFMIITAIVCVFVANAKGFKAGIATSAIVCTLFEIGLGIYNHDLSIWHFIIFPIMFAGFGVMPSGIGYFAKFIHKKLLRNRP